MSSTPVVARHPLHARLRREANAEKVFRHATQLSAALVLLLLASGKLKATTMRGGAQWLLADMLLFFVPAVLAILDHQEFLGIVGLKILDVILGGTAAVMCATALAVDFGYRMMMRLEHRHVSV